METHEVEVWVMVNEAGEADTGTDKDSAVERFSENCSTDQCARLICLKLKLAVQAVTTLKGDVPGEVDGGTVSLQVE